LAGTRRYTKRRAWLSSGDFRSAKYIGRFEERLRTSVTICHQFVLQGGGIQARTVAVLLETLRDKRIRLPLERGNANLELGMIPDQLRRRLPSAKLSRRLFLKQTVLAAGLVTSSGQPAERFQGGQGQNSTDRPWFQRTYRWGQTNITEADASNYDINWWREYWRRTRVQGVIINAGGIVAYYPSKYPLQYRPAALGNRDLYGELAQAAHADGLAVLARMDSNRVHEDFFKAHPDWCARDRQDNPYRSGDLYITCINSRYYEEWIPNLLREIIERSHPEGFADNSWSGLGRNSICHCQNCKRKFREHAGQELPSEKDWNNPVYRQWIEWNYARRLEVWDLNNRTTRAAGGPDCLWIGMNSGSISGQSETFRDLREICRRAEMMLLDHQARSDSSGFQQNGATGKLVHALLGWDKLAPESMALYQAGRPTFRKASKPEPEARLWILEGIAGGLQPWWHHVGAQQEDRRQFNTIESINRWHETDQQYLMHRRPVATIGVIWSQQNTDFYGRDHAEELVELPLRGMINALVRARLPYVMINGEDIQREARNLRVLILPNLAAISESQIASVREFVGRGGGLVLTGESGLFDEFGQPRPQFALADLMGARLPTERQTVSDSERVKLAADTAHTYLRLPAEVSRRHPVLTGFDDTDILPYGGVLAPLEVDADAIVSLTYVPPFPIYPPETSWMRQPKTSIPGLVLKTRAASSRVAYLPADIDRRYARDNLPDHGRLLANIIRWAAADSEPLKVEGPGLVDCHLYEQPGRLILHLVNLINAGTWRQPVDELIPVGPLAVKVRIAPEQQAKQVQFLVAQSDRSIHAQDGWVSFEVKTILDHEVAVISLM
jgi:hypothetical protein